MFDDQKGGTNGANPVHDLASAPVASQDRLETLQARFGRILNIHGEMAHSPAVIGAYGGVQDAIAEHGTFDALTREAIALAVGAADGCEYCQAAHTPAGLRAGLSEGETKAIRAGNPVSGKLDALLAVARSVARNLGEVDDDTWQRAVDAGWTDEELAELFAHVVVNMFTNYFNHYARTELDLPAPPLP